MENITKELVIMHQRDWLDYFSVLVPILLTIVIIAQNKIYERRNEKLQKDIHNREWSQQYHNEILILYNTYYEFCDTVISSGFSFSVRCGNVNAANALMNQIQILKVTILRRKDLARLLFGKKNPDLFKVIDACFENENSILDRYIRYVSSGTFWRVSENAWNTILPGSLFQRYDYGMLQQNPTAFDNFIKLCRSGELEEIEKLLQKDSDMHSYDKYHSYFEEYFSIDKLDS